MDTNFDISKSQSTLLVDIAHTLGFLVLWTAIVLAWREFVGADGGVLWLVHRLFG